MSAITYHGQPAHYLGPTRVTATDTYPGYSAIIATCECHGGYLENVPNTHLKVVA